MKKLIIVLLFATSAFADISVTQVETAMKQNNPQLVEKLAKEALTSHPNSAKAHYFLGQAYFHEGNMPAANYELRQAQKLAPDLSFTKDKTKFNDLLGKSSAPTVSPDKASTSENKGGQDFVKGFVSAGVAPENKPAQDNSISYLAMMLWGAILGGVGGIVFFLIKQFKRKNDQLEALGDEYDLDKEDNTTTSKLQDAMTGNQHFIATKRFSAKSSVGIQKPQQFQSTHTERPQIIIDDRRNSDGLVTGLLLGNMLSSSHHGGNTVSETNTTNNYYNDSDTQLQIDNSTSNWDFSDSSSTSSDWDFSGSSSSWSDDSSSSGFDSSSNDNSW